MVVDVLVQLACLVASCGLAAGWHLELVAVHISVGTEAPLNAQQDESFSRVLFCYVILSVAPAGRCWRSLWVCRTKLGGSTD